MKPLFDTETERKGARARLRELIREHSLRFGDFTLTSGAKSHFYLDLRRTTTHPEGAHLVAILIMDLLKSDWPAGAGGPSLGADPMAGALAALSHLYGASLPTFIVRGAAKAHGTQRQIEGHLTPGGRVVLLDDVVTRGGSLVRAAEVVREAGAEIQRVVTILDREAGGAEALARAGLSLASLFKLDDIVTPQEQAGAPPASANPAS